MPRHVPLDAHQHRDLRVIRTRGMAYGDATMAAVTFPNEFRQLQAHYPIVFQKLPDGRFQPVALFGFSEGENLFLQGAHWDAPVLPMSIERQPFLIGRVADGWGVHIDLDSPRVSTQVGELLFAEHGGTTPFLEHITDVLGQLHQGMEGVPAFVDALLAHELLESFVLDIGAGETASRLAGYYTIHEERLAALNGEALAALHQQGHLQPIFMAVASLSQFRALIDRRQRTLRHA